MTEPPIALPKAYKQDENQVGDDQFDIAERYGQGVDDGYRYEYEEVSHLPYGHRFRAIAYDAENSEKSQGESYLEFDTSQQEYQEEDTHADKHEREVVVSALALWVIEEMNDTPGNERVYREA